MRLKSARQTEPKAPSLPKPKKSQHLTTDSSRRRLQRRKGKSCFLPSVKNGSGEYLPELLPHLPYRRQVAYDHILC